MPDAILITGGSPQSYDDFLNNRPGKSAVFSVRYFRVDTQANLDALLIGERLADLPADAVVEHDEIIPPDGAALKPHELGHGAISSVSGAVEVARRARQNENSEIRRKGIASDTPIYLAAAGVPALRVNDTLPQPRPKRRLYFATDSYSGKDPKKQFDYQRRLKTTKAVEDYLNSIITDQPQTKTVFDIAEATGLDQEAVRDVLNENGHGYNGITF